MGRARENIGRRGQPRHVADAQGYRGGLRSFQRESRGERAHERSGRGGDDRSGHGREALPHVFPALGGPRFLEFRTDPLHLRRKFHSLPRGGPRVRQAREALGDSADRANSSLASVEPPSARGSSGMYSGCPSGKPGKPTPRAGSTRNPNRSRRERSVPLPRASQPSPPRDNRSSSSTRRRVRSRNWISTRGRSVPSSTRMVAWRGSMSQRTEDGSSYRGERRTPGRGTSPRS